MKELTSRQKQAIATELRITDTAMSMFIEYGYDNVKITDICKAANISVGNFYHYFESKEKIIDNSYKKIEDLIKNELDFNENDSYLNQIVYLMKTSSYVVVRDLGWKFMAQAYKQIITSPSKYTISFDRSTYQLLAIKAEKGLECGEFDSKYEVNDIVEACMRAGRGTVYDWCVREGTYDLVEMVGFDIGRTLKYFLA